MPLCVASFLRFAHRAVWRAARPRLPLRLSSSASCLLPLGFPSSWLSPRIASRYAPLLASPHRPANRVEKRGDTIVLLIVVRDVCLLGVRCRSCLKTFPVNLSKTFFGNFLKTFPDNLLGTVKHIPLPICHIPPFCGSIALRCRLLSHCSLFLVCILSWLKRRVFRIASRLASRPRPVIPSCPLPALCSHQSVLTAHSHSPRLVPASRPSCRHSLTPRLTDTHGGEKNGEETVA